MDKILLANSLLDNANTIFLVGEIGLAACYALDIEVSRIERFPNIDAQRAEFEEVKPFFIRLFQKAAEKGVNLQIPSDYLISPALDLIKAGGSSAPQTQESLLKAEGTEEKSQGSKLVKGKESAMAVAPATDEQPADQEVNNERERAILAANPTMHWTDVMI